MRKQITGITFSREVTKKEQYLLTLAPDMISIKNIDDDDTIDVDCWATFIDVGEDGKEVELLSFMDKDGNVYATNSATFMDSFMGIMEIYGDDDEKLIKKISGTTKAGRPFVNCTMG